MILGRRALVAIPLLFLLALWVWLRRDRMATQAAGW